MSTHIHPVMHCICRHKCFRLKVAKNNKTIDKNMKIAKKIIENNAGKGLSNCKNAIPHPGRNYAKMAKKYHIYLWYVICTYSISCCYVDGVIYYVLLGYHFRCYVNIVCAYTMSMFIVLLSY